MQQHPLAPDDILVERDPDGDIRTYAKMGAWTIETEKFTKSGRDCSDKTDGWAAYRYRDIWLHTGIEPDPDKCYDTHAYPPLNASYHRSVDLSPGGLWTFHTRFYCTECNVNIKDGCKHYRVADGYTEQQEIRP